MYIFIEKEISEFHIGMVTRKILSCTDAIIFVYINSPGGDPDIALSIYEALRLSGKKVVTYGMHEVMSSAVLIYLAGDERYAHEYTKFLIHEVEVEGEDGGKSKDKHRSAEELERDNDVMFSLIAERSKLTKARIRKEIAKAPQEDWDFGTDVAKKYGIVHGIGLPRDPKNPLQIIPVDRRPAQKKLETKVEGGK